MKKSPITKKSTLPKQKKTKEQDEMIMFQQYLMKKYEVQDESQLESVIEYLGEEGIKQEYVQFKKYLEQEKYHSFRFGGMLNKIIKLKTIN